MSQVTAAYGYGTVLNGVDVSVDAGQVVSLIGRNGAGKTTTARAIVQELVNITGGSVRFDGCDLVGMPSYKVIRRGIGYVPEDRRVFPSLSVTENLLVPAGTTHGEHAHWTIPRVYELFPQLGEYRTRIAGVMSGGEQQMLSIARSLLTNPRLLLLDEPYEGLAPKIVNEIAAAIRILKSEGIGILISEQSVRTIKECADRVVVIDKGITVFAGTTTELDANPEIARKHLMVA